MVNNICIVGSGTAGSVAALIYRAAFPTASIKIISSSDIGIVGVGEGSTEHWKMFMNAVDLPVGEVLSETMGTHKIGIRFVNWTTHTPDYFHSVSSAEKMNWNGIYTLYSGLNQRGKLLTNSIGRHGVLEGKVPASNPHESVNQFHFDTFKLNEYLRKKCIQKNIKLIEGEVVDVKQDPFSGFITSVVLSDGSEISSNFFIDASGFRRILMTKIGNTKWNSFKNHLPMDSAIAFPTPLPEDSVIMPFTSATAKSSGWMWEIPTQERRGNGYVFCSDFMTEDEAIQEASSHIGYQIEPARVFKFDPGCLDKVWDKNVIAIGLCSAFVEPLEATSIGSTIQQIFGSIKYLSSFNGNPISAQKYNESVKVMMDNLESMIALHYISDREDTEFWKYAKTMERPDYLNNLLDIWSVSTPTDHDIPINGFNLFYAPHFWHVAQGQGVLSSSISSDTIKSLNLDQFISDMIWEKKRMKFAEPLTDHFESLEKIRL